MGEKKGILKGGNVPVAREKREGRMEEKKEKRHIGMGKTHKNRRETVGERVNTDL